MYRMALQLLPYLTRTLTRIVQLHCQIQQVSQCPLLKFSIYSHFLSKLNIKVFSRPLFP
uniref:Uncharacterized protein n=1 Tax=Rhizophora mucronata TaxID=61149 RepID=A0A2P2QEA9_RHIMU